MESKDFLNEEINIHSSHWMTTTIGYVLKFFLNGEVEHIYENVNMSLIEGANLISLCIKDKFPHITIYEKDYQKIKSMMRENNINKILSD